jgi:hypothetical protein
MQSIAVQDDKSNVATRLHTGCTDQSELPADLARLIDAWPKLPEHVRRTILTLTDGCK